MRPIDADEVTRDLVSFKYSKEYGEVEEVYNRAVSDCIVDIEATPTLKNMKPVVHAHWIPECPNKRNKKAYRHTCSECGRTVYDARQVSIDEMGYAFCPNCGAKMDEEEKHETD